MKKIKVLLLVCVLFLLSGCVVEANIDMNPHGKVTEEVVISDSISKLGGSKERADLYISQVLNKYKPALDSREYTYSSKINSKSGVAVMTNTFDDINTYFEDTVFSQYLYRQMKWIETDEYYEIYNVTDHITYCPDCSDWPALPSVKVNIKLPIPALEQNADEVNGTTYTWIYDKNSPATKKFYLKISKEELKKNEIVYNQEVKRNNRIKIVGIIVFVLFIIVVVGIYVLKKTKQNKINY